MTRALLKPLVLTVAALGVLIAGSAGATTIERVVSPGGIEAWLVRDPSVPLVAINFAFVGGANEDPADKPGVAALAADLLDEGAGDLDAKRYHERLEDHAIELNFSAGRDHFSGTMRTMREHRDVAFDMLRLALVAPRFDAEAVERIRNQTLATLRRESTNPNNIAGRRWWSAAYPDHPYGRSARGTLESVPSISADDLKAYVRRVFARATLKIGVVGDIDPATLGTLLDRVFGALPASAELAPVPSIRPKNLGQRIVVDLDVPQAVVVFGCPGFVRKDPDFIPGFVVNHILGGGSFSSRLYREVREKRGLAYGIRTSLVPLAHSGVLVGSTATRHDRTADALTIIDQEVRRIAESGPTEEELAKTKSFLQGSYALNFDTSSKIAGILVQFQQDELGIDYIDRRNGLIEAVTIADVQRAAKRLFDGQMLVTVVGQPVGVVSKTAMP